MLSLPATMLPLQTLAHLLIVNAPAVFDSVFAASKSMLSPETQRKIQVGG